MNPKKWAIKSSAFAIRMTDKDTEDFAELMFKLKKAEDGIEKDPEFMTLILKGATIKEGA
jgi:hypothetical protein